VIKLIDDLLSEEELKPLYDEVMGEDFPWSYGRTVDAGEVENKFLIGWKKLIIFDKQLRYDPNNIIVPAINTMLSKAGETVKSIIRARLILNTIADKNYLNGVHTDLDHRHRTALFYFNDSDGDTILYKEVFDPTEDLDSKVYQEKIFNNTFTEENRITPKKNRLAIFNGLQYHSGETPTTVHRRVILNINYTI
jgi:hypothetical protein